MYVYTYINLNYTFSHSVYCDRFVTILNYGHDEESWLKLMLLPSGEILTFDRSNGCPLNGDPSASQALRRTFCTFCNKVLINKYNIYYRFFPDVK